ncbi:hypothetical protein BDV96DRAFT_644752 [Lophiotrema nucula]|uniref:RRM domain-containing protein n=1 Tax=Lophiotrema nucula TaxID=690887 RepID=A0A6A5ZF20_9PLEO|nr:hypothetical protein BDV96DRAFT_644752 [Lophiotrema nucula]
MAAQSHPYDHQGPTGKWLLIITFPEGAKSPLNSLEVIEFGYDLKDIPNVRKNSAGAQQLTLGSVSKGPLAGCRYGTCIFRNLQDANTAFTYYKEQRALVHLVQQEPSPPNLLGCNCNPFFSKDGSHSEENSGVNAEGDFSYAGDAPTKIYLSNLPENVNPQDLKRYLDDFEPKVDCVDIVLDFKEGSSTKYSNNASVRYPSAEVAYKVLAVIKKAKYAGRSIRAKRFIE